VPEVEALLGHFGIQAVVLRPRRLASKGHGAHNLVPADPPSTLCEASRISRQQPDIGYNPRRRQRNRRIGCRVLSGLGSFSSWFS
jgi:hypothetical protein